MADELCVVGETGQLGRCILTSQGFDENCDFFYKKKVSLKTVHNGTWGIYKMPIRLSRY